MMLQPMKVLLIVMLVVVMVVLWMRMYPYHRRMMQKPERIKSGRLMICRTMQGRGTSSASRARGNNQQRRVYAEMQA